MKYIFRCSWILFVGVLNGCAYSIPIAKSMELGKEPFEFKAKHVLPTYAAALEFCIEITDSPSWKQSVPDGVIRTKSGELITPKARVKYSSGEYKEYTFSGPATSPTKNLCWDFDERRSSGAKSIEITTDHPLSVNRIYWFRYHYN